MSPYSIRSTMTRLCERWQRFWFRSSGPEPLGLCRILFFGILAVYYARFDASAWGAVDPVFWRPIPLFRILDLPLLSPRVLSVLQGIWKLALVMSCLGILTRANTWIAWGLGIYLLGLINCFGKVSHQHQIVVIVLGIMALSRCGDAWSLDRQWRLDRHLSPTRDVVPMGGYSWPIRFVWLVFVSVFFISGISKLRISGIEWVTSDNLANLLIRAHCGTEKVWNTLGLELSRYTDLCQFIAAAVLVLELASPLALVSRSARQILIPGLLLMQVGISIVMGTSFLVFLSIYAFWIPGLWDVSSRPAANTD